MLLDSRHRDRLAALASKLLGLDSRWSLAFNVLVDSGSKPIVKLGAVLDDYSRARGLGTVRAGCSFYRWDNVLDLTARWGLHCLEPSSRQSDYIARLNHSLSRAVQQARSDGVLFPMGQDMWMHGRDLAAKIGQDHLDEMLAMCMEELRCFVGRAKGGRVCAWEMGPSKVFGSCFRGLPGLESSVEAGSSLDEMEVAVDLSCAWQSREDKRKAEDGY